jgi:hypothetical protein
VLEIADVSPSERLNKIITGGIGFLFSAAAQQIEHDDDHEHDSPRFPLTSSTSLNGQPISQQPLARVQSPDVYTKISTEYAIGVGMQSGDASRTFTKESAKPSERKIIAKINQPDSRMNKEVVKVRVRPFNYIGHIIERGQVFHTVRLASGALLIAPVVLVEAVE